SFIFRNLHCHVNDRLPPSPLLLPTPPYVEPYTEPPYAEPDHVVLATMELVPVEQVKSLRVLGLRKLWTVEALHFPVNINERTMDCLLDSSSEVNVLPYSTALSPGFAIYSDVRHEAMVDIKGAPFCGYMPDVPVRI